MAKISVVINTLNEEKNIRRAIESVKWADEVVVADDGSTDNTLNVLQKLKIENEKLKIFKHKSAGYVEPARNFAISKTTGDWILILDADEEISDGLVNRLQGIAFKMAQVSYVEIPRKNIIFGKWMMASMWWPDYNIRFFRKGAVKWGDEIHIPPKANGQGLKLEPDEKWAITHYNYESVGQFIDRMNRYSQIQAKELVKNGIKVGWQDLIEKPLDEFLSRFFANKGFEDGFHGLALSLLQAFSFLTVYLKVWEMEKFPQSELNLGEVESLAKSGGGKIYYWFKYGNLSKNPFKRFIQKIGNKII